MTPPECSDGNQQYEQGDQSPRDVGEIGVDGHLAPGADVLGFGQLQVGQFDVLWGISFRIRGTPARFIGAVTRLPAVPALTGTAFGCRGLDGGLIRTPRLTVELVQSGYVAGDGFLFIEAQMLGISADKTFVEYAAGKLFEALFFDGAEHARADLGGVGDVLELDAQSLALFAEFVAELSHAAPQSDLSAFPLIKIIIGQGRGLRHSWDGETVSRAVTEVRERAGLKCWMGACIAKFPKERLGEVKNGAEFEAGTT